MTCERIELRSRRRALLIGFKAFVRGDLLDRPTHPLNRVLNCMGFCVRQIVWQIAAPWFICVPFLSIFFRAGDPLTRASMVLLVLIALGVAVWGVRAGYAILSEHGKSVLKEGNS